MRTKSNLLLLMVALIWGTAFIAQGVAGQHHIATLFNGLCFIIASVILVPFYPVNSPGSRTLKGRFSFLKDRTQLKWMVIAGAVLFAATALQQIGILTTQVANAGFITSLYIVFTPILLWIFYRERPHWIDFFAVTIACVGAFLLSTQGTLTLHRGDTLEFVGSIFWAIHFVILAKIAFRYDSIAFASGHFFVAGIFNLIVGLVTENSSALMHTPVILAIVYRASLSIGIGYTIQVWGQKYTPPTDAALILGLESIFAAIAGWIALDQILSPLQIGGCFAIFGGVLISQFKPQR